MKNRALVRLAVELLKGFNVVVLVVKTDERKTPFDVLGDDDDDDDGGGGGDGDDREGGEVEVKSMDVR